MDSVKRTRSNNWEPGETALLKIIVASKYSILGIDPSNSSSNKMKIVTWNEILKSFNASNKRSRSLYEIKGHWANLKKWRKETFSPGLAGINKPGESQKTFAGEMETDGMVSRRVGENGYGSDVTDIPLPTVEVTLGSSDEAQDEKCEDDEAQDDKVQDEESQNDELQAAVNGHQPDNKFNDFFKELFASPKYSRKCRGSRSQQPKANKQIETKEIKNGTHGIPAMSAAQDEFLKLFEMQVRAKIQIKEARSRQLVRHRENLHKLQMTKKNAEIAQQAEIHQMKLQLLQKKLNNA